MTIFAWTAVCLVAFFLLSMRGALSDIKQRKVSNKLFVALACLWLIWRTGCILNGAFAVDQTSLEFECERSLFLLLQAFIVYAIMLIVVTIYERLTLRFAMGGADIKFMAACTAFLGWEAALLTIMLGCAVGIIFSIFNRINKTSGKGIPLVATIASILPLTVLII